MELILASVIGFLFLLIAEVLFGAILELLLMLIFEVLFLLIGYPLGWLLVTLGTLGTIEPGSFDRALDYDFYRSKGMKWWHVTYLDNGRRYLPAESVAATAWGLFILAGLLFAAIVYYVG